jgi:hypothetical protein
VVEGKKKVWGHRKPEKTVEIDGKRYDITAVTRNNGEGDFE